MEPVVLSSKRLILRPHCEEDATLLYKAVQDSFEALHRWMDWAGDPLTLEKTKDYIAFSKKCWSEDSPTELPMLIFDHHLNLIGSTGYLAINWKVPALEIGYWVNSPHEGCGYITEATNLLTQHAFTKWNAKRVEIRCDVENVKSAAIPERLGFKLEAHFKNHRVQPNSQKLSGTLVYARYDDHGMDK